MELRQYLSVLRSRLWLIATATVLCAAVGLVASTSSATYEARSTLYVGARNLVPALGDLSSDRLAGLERIALTFSKMIDTRPIAVDALKGLEGEHLARSADQVVAETTTSLEPSTQLLYVVVRDRDPAVAQALSNGLADTFVQAVQKFEPGSTEGAVPTLPAYVFERASRPTAPVRSGRLRTTLLATAFGLIAGAALAFLLDYLDLSLRSTEDVERLLELPVLGVIPAAGAAGLGDLRATAAPPPTARRAPARRRAPAPKGPR